MIVYGVKDTNILMYIMADFLKKLLTPYNIPFSKIRVGNNGDGGYIIFNTRLRQLDSVYSYGINNDVSFDLNFTDLSDAPIFMFDHTINNLPVQHKNFHFIKESGNYENIKKHISNTFPKSNRLFLKMDIEGHEWDIFNRLDDTTLLQFEQMTIEFHNLEFLQNDYFGNFGISYDIMYSVFSKLNKHFYLGHIHGNNCGGFKDIPNTIECTYIRKDLLGSIPEIETIPYPISELDYPNAASIPDYTLDWWIK